MQVSQAMSVMSMLLADAIDITSSNSAPFNRTYNTSAEQSTSLAYVLYAAFKYKNKVMNGYYFTDNEKRKVDVLDSLFETSIRANGYQAIVTALVVYLKRLNNALEVQEFVCSISKRSNAQEYEQDFAIMTMALYEFTVTSWQDIYGSDLDRWMIIANLSCYLHSYQNYSNEPKHVLSRSEFTSFLASFRARFSVEIELSEKIQELSNESDELEESAQRYHWELEEQKELMANSKLCWDKARLLIKQLTETMDKKYNSNNQN